MLRLCTQRSQVSLSMPGSPIPHATTAETPHTETHTVAVTTHPTTPSPGEHLSEPCHGTLLSEQLSELVDGQLTALSVGGRDLHTAGAMTSSKPTHICYHALAQQSLRHHSYARQLMILISSPGHNSRDVSFQALCLPAPKQAVCARSYWYILPSHACVSRLAARGRVLALVTLPCLPAWGCCCTRRQWPRPRPHHRHAGCLSGWGVLTLPVCPLMR
jgi:hypothetical protein